MLEHDNLTLKINLKISIINKMQDSGLKRNTLDKFYTKPQLVDDCINNISKFIIIDKKNDIVI